MRTQRTVSTAPGRTGQAARAVRGLARTAWHGIATVIREANYATSRLTDPAVTGR